LGTVIPQQEGTTEFASQLSPGVANLFNSLQLFDMYHSVWFRLIISFLALNLIICSIDRFPGTLRLFRSKPKPDRLKPFEGLAPERSLSLNGELGEVTGKVVKVLKGQYKDAVTKETDKGNFLYVEKGRFTLFGVYLVHLSVLLILSGAIIGSLFGFNGYVTIVEGESVDSISLRNNTAHTHKDLGFNVACEKFSIDFYDTGAPKEYRSDLVFSINGDTVQKGSLLVNHPIKFMGVTFYQAYYGSTPGSSACLRVSRSDSMSDDSLLDLEIGKPVSIPGDGGQITLSDLNEDFMRMGPAASVLIKSPDGEEINFWLFEYEDMIREMYPEMFDQFAKLNPSAYKPYTFYLDSIESINYTVLQANRDPGVPIVYAGFLIIIIGLIITFFTSHKRVWVRVMEAAGKIDISVAGKANKNPVGMDRELDQLISRLEKELPQERTI
jgi:cytochrome c biogenesis protein